MSIPPKVEVRVDAANSCNRWFCCFGCTCCEKPEEAPLPDSPLSISITTTTEERTTRVYREHVRSHHNTPESTPRK